jgi:hypothetical protein
MHAALARARMGRDVLVAFDQADLITWTHLPRVGEHSLGQEQAADEAAQDA